jgi:hypothetical protein
MGEVRVVRVEVVKVLVTVMGTGEAMVRVVVVFLGGRSSVELESSEGDVVLEEMVRVEVLTVGVVKAGFLVEMVVISSSSSSDPEVGIEDTDVEIMDIVEVVFLEDVMVTVTSSPAVPVGVGVDIYDSIGCEVVVTKKSNSVVEPNFVRLDLEVMVGNLKSGVAIVNNKPSVDVVESVNEDSGRQSSGNSVQRSKELSTDADEFCTVSCARLLIEPRGLSFC